MFTSYSIVFMGWYLPSESFTKSHSILLNKTQVVVTKVFLKITLYERYDFNKLPFRILIRCLQTTMRFWSSDFPVRV